MSLPIGLVLVPNLAAVVIGHVSCENEAVSVLYSVPAI